MVDPVTPVPHDRIEPVGLEVEMQRSYLDYAMSVIVGRALPRVEDGLKPVHRRVLYAMYDGGYRPDRGYFKCARVVGDVIGNYHPHGDSSIYDALVRLAQSWSMRYPLVDGNGNFGSPGNDPAAAMRYTECRLMGLAMEMLRDIDEDTVDFSPNYDGRSQEPNVLPSRIPNLLVNGSAGIAVGMATNIPPHNLREVAAGVQFVLANPDLSQEETLQGLIERIPGPDFPTGGLILGRSGIEEAYRTGRGSVRMRAVVEVEEDNKGRATLVVTELPFQVNPDNLALHIADLVKDQKIAGIANIQDESSARAGQRLVVVLKRDSVPKVVLNNLFKHTQLQQTFGVNMLAIVDGVPRTLRLDEIIGHYVRHQVEVIVRRTRYRLGKAQERLHILEGYLTALDHLDEVIELIRNSESAESARNELMTRYALSEVQAVAILDMQLRRLAALERQKIIDEAAEKRAIIAELESILASPERQRQIVSDELAEVTEKYGDDRRTQIIPYEGDMSIEDFIPEEQVVVTVTRGGYAKRTKTDLYRSQKRGGKGVQGAALKQDDIIDHFFVTSTHHWILFFTNQGRVYRAKAHELPDTARAARGQHVANILAFQPEEKIAQVISLKDYGVAPYLVLATRRGLVKKTGLREYDSNRSGGLIAVNLREDDELIGAALVSAEDDLLLVSRQAQSIRFHADDVSIRPMGRPASGVRGMRINDEDEVLAMEVVAPDSFLLTASAGGYVKRTPLDEYPVYHRGGKGVLTAELREDRGVLAGALVVREEDEIYAVTSHGGVIRTRVAEVPPRQRRTLGVRLIDLPDGVEVIGIALNAASEAAIDELEVDEHGNPVPLADPAGDEDAALDDAVESGVEEES